MSFRLNINHPKGAKYLTCKPCAHPKSLRNFRTIIIFKGHNNFILLITNIEIKQVFKKITDFFLKIKNCYLVENFCLIFWFPRNCTDVRTKIAGKLSRIEVHILKFGIFREECSEGVSMREQALATPCAGEVTAVSGLSGVSVTLGLSPVSPQQLLRLSGSALIMVAFIATKLSAALWFDSPTSSSMPKLSAVAILRHVYYFPPLWSVYLCRSILKEIVYRFWKNWTRYWMLVEYMTRAETAMIIIKMDLVRLLVTDSPLNWVVLALSTRYSHYVWPMDFHLFTYCLSLFSSAM